MDIKSSYEVSQGTLPKIKRPISRTVSLQLTILITLVTIFVGITSYFYSMMSAEELVHKQILEFVNERGLRESALFLESDAYQLRFQKEYVERYTRMGDKNPIEWFEEHMEKRPEDGTYRSKPELYYGKDKELGRRDVSSSMMISAKTKVTSEVILALAIGYDMINQYGPAWRKPFVDLYFSSPEKTSVSRWPGTPWGLMMDDKVEWREEEWMAITMKEINPQREQRWSGVLYDERNGNWMVSGVTPLDIDGKQVGMVGTDLLLDDLVKRTINETMSGSYNILMQADGRLIVHPHKIKEIIANKGMLMAQTSPDKHLLRIYEFARTATTFPLVIDNKTDDEHLAVTQIQGPDWYFITVHPGSLLKAEAMRTVGFVCLLGMASLVVMFIVIRLILKHNLIYPLKHFTQTVQKFEIPQGKLSDRTNEFVEKISALSTRPDEIGLLANSFVDMAGHLKNTYKAIQESEEKFRIVFEQAPDSIVLIDAETGKIIEFNDRAHEVLGYTREEFGNLVLSEIDVNESKEDVKTHIEKIKRDGFDMFEAKHMTKDGRLLDAYVTVRAFSMHGHSFIVSIWTDITARKQAEEEKVNLETRLQQAQKMEAIGTLAGGIAHDFNNILGAILGYAEMARDDSPSGSTVVKDLNKVLEAGNRAKDLVQQILAFSRKDDTERILLQPASIVKEAIRMLRSTLPTTIDINHNIAPQTGLIFADPTQIHQILMNLGTNAFHAMEKTGGKLDISLKETEHCNEDLVHEPNVEAGTFVQLSICDSGPGIAPEIKDKIFDPYFTTKETGKGTGMGLSIVHGIVKSYGGFITTYSELGEGAAFHVFLPVIEEKVLPEIETADQIPIGKERILFIDDEEILTEVGKDVLERLGYHVTVRNSSLEALETFQNQPDQFDVVITDQTMPGMTGADLARRMMQIRPDIPVILCTGYSTIISEEKAKSMGIKEFTLKPLAKNDIAKLIRRVLDTS